MHLLDIDSRVQLFYTGITFKVECFKFKILVKNIKYLNLWEQFILEHVANRILLIIHYLNESENDLTLIDIPHFVPIHDRNKPNIATSTCVVKGYEIINIPIFTNEYIVI